MQEGAASCWAASGCSRAGSRATSSQPTILTNVRHGTLPTTEEIFGPVISI